MPPRVDARGRRTIRTPLCTPLASVSNEFFLHRKQYLLIVCLVCVLGDVEPYCSGDYSIEVMPDQFAFTEDGDE